MINRYLCFLITAKFKVLASLDANLMLVLAGYTFQSQNDLLGGLCLFVKDRLGLTSKPRLLAVVTSLTLGKQRCFPSLVLRHLVGSVFSALFALAKGISSFGDVDHENLDQSAKVNWSPNPNRTQP